eukprot:CAMPEP_0198244750 /NCGR_PEP_ID=MMETSP1446-20131203/37381_1 /TAXON_ID=1461542 ORGANISM="Unidentified sp, Strain CCMP2111" /NCGR_SAMPLE_ID=MMETSP1446 /ASSEMBLY_ACC=CAM_ASM_001112 /LENGTH=55 /DNA_ID=CAMNT_0043928847 /DNA_START=126 /DNA_END=294 /DNA_ORIENTATION=+
MRRIFAADGQSSKGEALRHAYYEEDSNGPDGASPSAPRGGKHDRPGNARAVRVGV